MSNQTIQKKIIENDLKYSVNSLSPSHDLIQLTKSIFQIKQLCQSRTKVQLQQLQGDKICIICEQNNNNIDLEDQNLVKYLRCKKCQQAYHENCLLKSSEDQFQLCKNQIEGTDDYNTLAEFKPTFQIFCLRCNSQDCFNDEINYNKINYIQQLNQICQQMRDKVYDQIVEKKRKQGSCQICNFVWLKRQAEHQIFDCNLDDNKEFQEEIKSNDEKPQIIRKIIKLSNCKHVFCQDCLSDKVFTNQILQEDFDLSCQAENCEDKLTFTEIFQILANKYNWFMKYKHQKFQIKELDKQKDNISFVRCRGVYKLARQDCLGIKLQDRKQVIDCIQEILQLEQQIKNENRHSLPDLKKIQTVKLNDQESIQCCNRAYQIIRNQHIDMKAIFEEILNQTVCEKEKQERKVFYDQYLKSQIKPFPDPAIEQQQDCYFITCDDENCLFEFCINGCLDIHKTKNQCPNAQQQQNDENNQNNNIFNIDLNDVVKNIGASTLHFKQLDGSVILTDGAICYRCFREIKHDAKNDENQPYHNCKCCEEYNKIQNDNNEQENDQNGDNNQQIYDQNNIQDNQNEKQIILN
ncbi:hypothetical protein ABPG72_009804 [Tetrahymena utriculariae]